MEITSGILNRNKLREELTYIITFLKNHSSRANYMYGLACNVDIEEQWKHFPISIDDIDEKVSELIDKGIFNYCDSDLYISDGDNKFKFLLCHECDVHFESEDLVLVKLVRNDWEQKEYNVYEIKNSFYCRITDSLISEYDVVIDGASTDNTYKGIYWEAAAYFDENDFTLNAFAVRVDDVKEIEVLKIPLKKVNQIRIFEASYEAARFNFKVAPIAGATIGIMALLTTLIHPQPGYTDFGFILFITLFLGIGSTLLFYAIQLFLPSPKNIVCINLITYDKRLITLYTDIEQKELVIEILSKYFRDVKNKGLPSWEINLN